MPKWDHPRENCLIACLMLLLGVCPVTLSNRLRLSVEEGQPPETVVGDISVALPSEASTGGYFISEGEESVVLRDLKVDGVSGVIKTARVLDRETRDRYQFVAVTVSGHMVTVEITVTDINDHSPVFPRDTVQLNISELTPNGTRFRLEPAWDPDTGIFSVQSYAITAGNPGLFQLRPGNGLTRVELVLGGLLDRENREYYSLTVQASDGGTPPRTGTMQLVVRVLDENDNPPRFERTEYEAWVREDAVPGTRIIRLQASDPDQGTNGFVTYEIDRRRSGPSGRFAIESRSGEVRLRGPLDRERRPRYQLVIRACDHGSPAGLGSAFLSVRLLDVNDNRPSISIVYLSPSGRAEVSEGAAPGQPVARVSVGDPDLGEGGELRVWLHDDIEGPSGGGSFELRHTPLASIFLLSVNRRLDRERRRAHHLTVLASDSARPPLTSRCSLQLHVADVNDNAPAFEREVYEAHVAEGPLPASIRAPLLQVSARDPDAGANGTVRYAILAEGAPPVRVDPLTGWISAAACLDRESHEVIRLSVVARDLGEPPLSSTVSVLLHVDDVNDNEPAFEQQLYTATVREHTEPGTCFLQVNARDADAGLFGTIHYFLYDDVNNYEKSHLFTIDSSSGQICTTQNMDRDNGPPSYDLLVIAEDGGGLSAQSFIHLDLQDINDNQPLFNPLTYVTSISSHTQPGTEITNVMASDRDSGVNGKVSYELLTGNFSSLFSVDSSTGAVYLTSTFSHLQVSDVQLKISARDGGNLTSSLNATVTVHILQSSVAPTVFEQSSYSFTILESVPIGSAVGRVQVASIQDSLELKYRISSGDPNGYFSIESKSGLIRSNKQLDHEAQPFVMLTIESQTSSSPVYSYVQVNITIIDVNDNAPAFHQESEIITISKNTLPGTVLYIAHAEDKDSGLNGIIMYSLQNDYEQTFSIDYVHGTLYLNRTVFSKKKQYSIHILASDHGAQPLSTVFMLLVNVDHLDGNLTFETLIYEVEVSEAAPFNMRILQVHAHMQDSKVASGLVYSLQQNLDSLTFGIHAASGWIYIHKALDYEKKHSYSFKVFATNPKEHLKQSAIASVIVNVMDENDNPPLFTQNLYFFTIEESPIPQGLVGKVQATDQDSGKNSHLSFILLSDGKFFRLNSKTGEIINWVALDREQHIHHQLSVLVTDHGVPRQNASTTIYITVSDINDNRPLFSYPGPSREFFIKVLVAQPEGTFLTTLIAKDPDVGKNGTVSFSILENYSNSFKIDAKTGELRTAKVFMYNYISHHKIVVMASDAGSPPLHQIAEINIQVIPRVIEKLTIHNNQRYFTIPEGLRPGNVVGSISSYDHHLLTSQRIHYYIDEDDDHFPFEVDRMTGELYQSNELDYEEIPHYLLKVIEEDNSHILSRNISIFVSIKIEDQNDHSPWFKDDVVVIGIEENLPVGSLVHIFNAKDDDGSRPNSELRYSVMSWSSTENPFYIDPYQGCLNTTLPVDHEMTKTFLLTITAMDQALNVNERKVGSVTAQIIVLDVNDNKPIFLSENVSYVMEDEEVGYLVHHIIAYDADAGESGRILYAIISGNEDNTFKLDESSGLLTLVSHLDHEIQKSYTLTISGWDNGFPIQSSTQILMVVVVDINDEAPKFQDSVYEIGVPENLNVDAYVVKVEAFDGDSDLNSALIYEILPGSGYDAFKINPQTGIITTTQVLDREIQEYFVIKVLVRDSGTPSLSDTSTVMVTVLDENDHQPEFMPHLHELHISENMDPGIIYALTALDKDAGKNGLVRYEIIGGNFTNTFKIDSVSGTLATIKGLDREEFNNCSLTIEAHDLGNPQRTSQAEIWIIILDENDNSPVFKKMYYHIIVNEDVPVGSSVYQLIASDKDDGFNGEIAYSLIDDTFGAFTINSNTGIIVTTNQLDRETKSQYAFRAMANDNSIQNPRSTTVNVMILIEDANDNFPIFKQNPIIAYITVNTQISQVIATVKADDKDLGQNGTVTFQILEHDSLFAVNNTTGDIYPKTSPSERHFGRNNLSVVAVDQGNPVRLSTGLVLIHWQVEKGRTWFSRNIYEITVAENIKPGTLVLTVTNQDYHTNGVTYSIFSGNENEAFHIDSKTGEIVVNDSKFLDYEVRTKMHLVLLAKNNRQTAYSQLTILIEDVNDNQPHFQQNYYKTSIWEGQTRNTYVMQVFASDSDHGLNGQIEYSIISGNENKAFVIDSARGIITTNAVLDREVISSYRLVLQAADRGSPRLSITAIVGIQVLDVNDNAPSIPPLKAVQIFENLQAGYVVTQILASDLDLNPVLSYNFTKNGNPEGKFAIDCNTGAIILTEPLDYEKQSEYLVKIKISDSVHETEAALGVYVMDLNDNSPVFSQESYQIVFPELSPVNTYILTVSATDKDTGVNGKVSYRILPGTSTEFYINAESGALFTRRTVHYTSYNSVVQLLVEAKDDGNPALKSITSVEIRIQDINNHIPQFNQAVYNISVNEEAATGIILLLFSTLDQDWTRKNAYVDYIIIGGNEQNKFHIENTVIKRENQYSVVGKLLLKNVLDRELTDSYHLVVCASDRGNPSLSSTTIVSITVLDFNDNPPVFNSLDYHIEVLESTPVKNQLIQVSAYDQDQGANADIRYNIISGNEKEYFRLDHKTGFVELKLPLDYEQVSKFMLTIQAIDGSVTNQKMAISILYINVLDDNDNVPYFVFPTLNCAVNENEPIYTSVCAVHAFDNDDGAFGYLTYSILTLPLTDYSMYTSWNNFIIDPVTGDIYTKQLIDYEQQKKCIFVVQAKDKGNASATATIQVHIQSIDEYEPTFTQDRYYFTLPNLVEVGQKTGQVTAVDKDAGLDGIVQFSFLKPSPYFSLNQTSGVIYVSGSIHNIRGSYKGEEVIDLVIKASSPLMGSKSAISTVAINISQSLDALIGKSTDHLTLSLSVSFVIFLLLSVCCGGLVYRYKAKDKNNSSFGKQNIKLPIISTIINHLNHPVVSSGHQKVNDKQRGKTPVNSPEQLSLVDIPVKTKSFSSSRQCIADGQTAEDREIMMFSANQHSRNQVPESSKPGWTYSVPDSEHTKESYCLSCQLCQNNTTDAVINRESVGSIYNFKDIREEEGFNVDFIDDDVSRNIQNPSIKKNSVMMDNAKNHIFIMDGRTSLIESLNSLVPIQDQIQNSYNYDYVLTWKPGFQPLASAFTEIAKLKDENVLKPVIKNESKSTLPPPLITSIAQQGIRVVPPQMPIVKFNPSTLKYSSLPVATNTYSSTSAITSNFSPSVSVQTPSASTGLSSGIPELTLRQSSHKQKLEENTDVITLSN
ncbi:protocadherin-23 isoform X1 [Chiloscyllium plagiosum]|uniref:protocadherin-23 isoform X1 n=1 Tax=Chiloscyllium plagiosum TaxID=36176 RepID=UPI001CB818A0|nr:protocadherin-23 isoform X1 [Chiloscyllium plagiosum]